MLYELLLALYGYEGAIFKIKNGDELIVDNDILNLHPAEKDVLTRICEIGSGYIKLNNFVVRYSGYSYRGPNEHEPSAFGFGSQSNKDEGLPKGIYLQTFCLAMEDATLSKYRESLVNLEVELLEKPYIKIMHIQSRLEQYRLLFWSLSIVAEEIVTLKCHGCQILNVLHKHSMSGVPEVQEAVRRIQHACHMTLVKQLNGWLLYGKLLDKYDELFIQCLEDNSSDGWKSGSATTSLSSTTSDESNIVQVKTEEDVTGPDKYKLCGHLIPTYFPLHLTDTILFIGSYMGLLRSRPLDCKENLVEQFKALTFDKEFTMTAFEEQLNYMKEVLGKKLHQMMKTSGLIEHLKEIKDFYLLGRGELFLAFIDQCDTLLKMPASNCFPLNCMDVHAAFSSALQSVFLDEDIMKRFQIGLEPVSSKGPLLEIEPFGSDKDSATGWDCLVFKFTPKWPLSLLMSPSVVDKYSKIFHFLLRVKRVQLQLHRCWALQMSRFHHKSVHADKNEHLLWQLCNLMMFIVDNLQYYLQSQYSILMERIQHREEFDCIQKAHDTFVITILCQSFLSMRAVGRTVQDYLSLCARFSTYVLQYDQMERESRKHELELFWEEYHRQVALLFRILSSVSGHQASPHLSQLLTRIDFNKYFTSSTEFH